MGTSGSAILSILFIQSFFFRVFRVFSGQFFPNGGGIWPLMTLKGAKEKNGMRHTASDSASLTGIRPSTMCWTSISSSRSGQ